MCLPLCSSRRLLLPQLLESLHQVLGAMDCREYGHLHGLRVRVLETWIIIHTDSVWSVFLVKVWSDCMERIDPEVLTGQMPEN